MKYCWTCRDVEAVKALGSEAIVTPYSIRAASVPEASELKAGDKTVYLTLSDSTDEPRWVTRAFNPPSPTIAAWEWLAIDEKLLRDFTGTTVAELCRFLCSNRPELYPKEQYDWDNLDASGQQALVNMLLNHPDRENSRHRNAVIDWLPESARFVMGQPDETVLAAEVDLGTIPYALGGEKLSRVLTVKEVVQEHYAKEGENVADGIERPYDELKRLADELRTKAKDALELVARNHEHMRTRLRVVAPLETVRVLVGECAVNASHFAETAGKAQELAEKADTLVQTLGRVMWEHALDDVSAAYLAGGGPAKYLGVVSRLAQETVELHAILFLETVPRFSRLRSLCRTVLGGAMAAGEYRLPKYQTLVAELADAMLWALDVLAEVAGTEEDTAPLARLLDSVPAAPAETADELDGALSPLDIVLRLAGPKARVRQTDWGERTESLLLSLICVYAVWQLPRAAQTAQVGKPGANVEALREKIVAGVAIAVAGETLPPEAGSDTPRSLAAEMRNHANWKLPVKAMELAEAVTLAAHSPPPPPSGSRVASHPHKPPGVYGSTIGIVISLLSAMSAGREAAEASHEGAFVQIIACSGAGFTSLKVAADVLELVATHGAMSPPAWVGAAGKAFFGATALLGVISSLHELLWSDKPSRGVPALFELAGGIMTVGAILWAPGTAWFGAVVQLLALFQPPPEVNPNAVAYELASGVLLDRETTDFFKGLCRAYPELGTQYFELVGNPLVEGTGLLRNAEYQLGRAVNSRGVRQLLHAAGLKWKTIDGLVDEEEQPWWDADGVMHAPSDGEEPDGD